MATLLALETSTEYCSAALLHEQSLFVRRLEAGSGQSGRVLELVQALLNEAGLQLKDCAALAFDAGPGAFTGLRMACAVTQGLAFGADKPVIPIGSLVAIAEQMRQAQGQLAEGSRVLSALDARMGEVYWCLLEWRDDEWQTLIPASLDTPARLRQTLLADAENQKPDYGCGNALRVFASELSDLVRHGSAEDLIEYPDAGGVVALAARAWACGLHVPASVAAPLYVRDRVALTTAERAEQSAQLTQSAQAAAPSLLTSKAA